MSAFLAASVLLSICLLNGSPVAATPQAQEGAGKQEVKDLRSRNDELIAVTGGAGLSAFNHQTRGDKLLGKGQMREAALSYARASLANPKDPLLRLSTAVTLAAVGRLNDAVPQLRKALELAEDDVITALLLREALAESGRTAEAQELYLDTARRYPRKNGKPGLDASTSISRLSLAVRQSPESPVYFLLLGDAYQLAEEWAKADEAYHTAIRLAPRWIKPRVNLGISRLAQGKSDEAIETFQDAFKLEPGNVQVNLLMGDAQISAGRNSDAVQTFTRISKMRGASKTGEAASQAMVGMGQAFANDGAYDKAVASLNQARKLNPRDPAPAALLGEIEVQAGNYVKAADAYHSALQITRGGGLFSNRPILYRALSEAQLSAGKHDAALATLQRAFVEEPGQSPLWHRLSAQAHFARGNDAQGEASLQAALECDDSLYPQDTLNALAAQGLVLKMQDLYRARRDAAATGILRSTAPGGGLALSNKVAPLSPRGASRVIEILGHLARYQNDIREEVRLREENTRQSTNTGRDWFLLAEAYDLRAGEPANARASYLRALELGGLSAPAAEWAKQRLKALTAPLYKP